MSSRLHIHFRMDSNFWISSFPIGSEARNLSIKMTLASEDAASKLLGGVGKSSNFRRYLVLSSCWYSGDFFLDRDEHRFVRDRNDIADADGFFDFRPFSIITSNWSLNFCSSMQCDSAPMSIEPRLSTSERFCLKYWYRDLTSSLWVTGSGMLSDVWVSGDESTFSLGFGYRVAGGRESCRLLTSILNGSIH